MKKEENYLLTIFKEHLENPYNTYRLSMAGGCIEIEERLYGCAEQGLGLESKLRTKIHDMTDGRYISAHPNARDMMVSIIDSINELTDDQVDQMARFVGNRVTKRMMQQRFYLSKSHDLTNTYLKFIIMYIYGHAGGIFGLESRDEVMTFMKNKITQPVVIEAINFMNKRYSKNVLGVEVDI